MATTYTYPDAFLNEFCTEAVEARAVSEIDLIEQQLPSGQTFDAEWTERLTITQTYIFAAIDNQAAPDDLFAEKIKIYRAQFQTQLPQATAAASAAANQIGGLGLFSIPLERA